MATYATLADRLIYRLGNRRDIGPSSLLTSKAYEFLYNGALELAHRLKHLGVRVPLLEQRIDYSWPANTEDTAYGTLLSNGRLYAVLSMFDRTNQRRILYSEPTAFEHRRVTAPTDIGPTYFTSYEEKVSVTPKPTAIFTARLLGYLNPAAIAATTQTHEFDASYEPGLLLLAEADGWDGLDNFENATAAEQKFERWLERKKSRAEHERSQFHSRGLRPHARLIADRDLGI